METRVRQLKLGADLVRYREAGAGPAVVLVHGLGLSSRSWVTALEALARAGLRAVAPDLPGFGGSGGRRGMGVGRTAEWLLALADALGLERPSWVGHSISCQAVIALASEWPHRARSLVLASPTGGPRRLRRLHQVIGLVRDLGREPRSVFFAVAREYVRASPVAYLQTWLEAGCDEPLERAHRITSPALIIAGINDPIAGREYLELLASRMPAADLLLLPGGAHGVVFGRSTEFNQALVSFFRATAN